MPRIRTSAPSACRSSAISPMTQAALRGGRFIAASTPHARTAAAAEAMLGAESSLMYFYVNDLDKAGHRYGCQSAQWEHQLEELDATVQRLNATLPAGTTVLLTGGPRHARRPRIPADRLLRRCPPSSPASGTRRGSPAWSTSTLSPEPASSSATRLIEAWRASVWRPDLGLHPGRGHGRRPVRRCPARGQRPDRRRDDRCP